MTNDIHKIHEKCKKIIGDKGANECPNRYVGIIEKIHSDKEFPAISIDIDKIKSNRKILLILESPHIDEYTKDGKPLIAANGKTGEKIHTYISSLLKCCEELLGEELNKLELCLINAIPFQCSEGKPLTKKDNKINRDEIFIHIWGNRYQFKNEPKLITGEEYFKNILKSLYQSEDIIINCCTKELKYLVQHAINEIVEKDNYRFISTHPASWRKESHCYVYKTGVLFKEKSTFVPEKASRLG